MANITDYLKQILSARYGRDVRQSIHDAIHQCYEDGKAGSIDLVAREEIQATNEVVQIAVETANTASGAVEAIKSDLGDDDISDIGDGTVTGAVRHLADRPSGGGDSAIWISEAEFNALSEEERNTGTYDIYDKHVYGNAYTMPFTSELYEAKNTGDALVEVANKVLTKANRREYVNSVIGTTPIIVDSDVYQINCMVLPYPDAGAKAVIPITIDLGILKYVTKGSTYVVTYGVGEYGIDIIVQVTDSNISVALRTAKWAGVDVTATARLIVYVNK